jgi:hypothetical protein
MHKRQHHTHNIHLRDILGDETLLKDVHHLPTKINHCQRHPEEGHPVIFRRFVPTIISRFSEKTGKKIEDVADVI